MAISGSIHRRIVLERFWNRLGRNPKVVTRDSLEMRSGLLFQKMISEWSWGLFGNGPGGRSGDIKLHRILRDFRSFGRVPYPGFSRPNRDCTKFAFKVGEHIYIHVEIIVFDTSATQVVNFRQIIFPYSLHFSFWFGWSYAIFYFRSPTFSVAPLYLYLNVATVTDNLARLRGSTALYSSETEEHLILTIQIDQVSVDRSRWLEELDIHRTTLKLYNPTRQGTSNRLQTAWLCSK